MRESDVERYLVNQVQGLGGICRKWVCPGRKGVPDRICIFPGNLIYFVEGKSTTGKPSKHQIEELGILKSLDCHVLIINSVYAVDRFIRQVKYKLKPKP